MNTDKLDEMLIQYLRNPDTSQTEEIPIIITIDRVTKDLDFLEERGFHVKYHYQNINAVAGTANARSISSLSAIHTVTKIEYDGKLMHFPGKNP